MPKARPPSAIVAGSADDIEAAFYEALQTADIDKLMACWADEDEIVCVHPGGARLIGAAAIRAGFDAIFANGSIRVRPQQVRRVESLASAVHSLVESIEVMTPEGPVAAHVIATNIYHRLAQGWRLVAHHASPGTAQELREDSAAPPVLH
jgi:ketosteroid isomerase-like protein